MAAIGKIWDCSPIISMHSSRIAPFWESTGFRKFDVRCKSSRNARDHVWRGVQGMPGCFSTSFANASECFPINSFTFPIDQWGSNLARKFQSRRVNGEVVSNSCRRISLLCEFLLKSLIFSYSQGWTWHRQSQTDTI